MPVPPLSVTVQAGAVGCSGAEVTVTVPVGVLPAGEVTVTLTWAAAAVIVETVPVASLTTLCSVSRSPTALQ